MTAPLIDRLAAQTPDLRGRLLAGQPLGPLTWFRVGGPAEVLFTPADEADLAYFLPRCPADVPVYPLGVGSNMIVRDGGVEGVVVRLSPRGFGQASASGDVVSAGAAALDRRVAETAFEAGIGGLEFYFGIPGSIGGAITMNAGANGGETKDVLVEARGVTRAGEIVTLSNADLRFEYRRSHPPEGFIFTSATFRGRIEDKEAIRARMEAFASIARPPSRSARKQAARPSRTRPAIPPGSWWTQPAAGA